MTIILLIDDNAPLHRILGDILAMDGHDVWEADSGFDGLRMARDGKPDLILGDITPAPLSSG